MLKDIVLNHVAVECMTQDSADIFFTTVLGIPKLKSTVLSKELSAEIFQIESPVTFQSYDNGKTRIEVFIIESKRKPTYIHLGIEVDNKNEFITRCAQYGLKPFFVKKGDKQLLFVRDFSGNLYEIK
jgi:catechol 2,3-dioxygenase-like lactoylglutathione lyase family enzyme